MNDEGLWDRWRKHYEKCGSPPPCEDGPCPGGNFESVRLRVMLVLREPNSKQKLTSYRIWEDFEIWPNLRRWAVGLLKNFPKFDEMESSSPQFLKECVRQVAIINLKKATGGTGTANKAKIKEYVRMDQDLLREQILCHIKPQIIVACGKRDVAQLLSWLLYPPRHKERIDLTEEHEKPFKTSSTSSEIWIVPFRHPTRARKEDSYNELKRQIELEPELKSLVEDAP